MDKPDFTPNTHSIKVDYVNKLLGLELTPNEIKLYLERMRHGVEITKNTLTVSVAPYRSDILHPIDLVEDVAIAYGYMKFTPKVPKLYSLGQLNPLEKQCEHVRDNLIGLGFMEVMTLILTNERDLFERMNCEIELTVSATKPVSLEQGVARNWLLPSLMVVLEKNRNREYPQKIFEVGACIQADGSTQMKAAGAIAYGSSNFSEIKSQVYGLAANIGFELNDEPYNHPSFIEGRCCKNQFGFYGEISPNVLCAYGIEVPVSAFEFTLG